MQLAAHEAHDLNELTLSCVNSITNMALFLDQVKDTQLRSLLQKHFPYHVQDYNRKVEYLSRSGGAKTGLPIPEMTKVIESQGNIDLQPTTPRTSLSQLDDREIATAYWMTLKRAGREYAWAAMEASNPEIRTFLEHAFIMSSHHAYDIWQWMVSKGYYPLEAAPSQTMGTFGNMYRAIPEINAAVH